MLRSMQEESNGNVAARPHSRRSTRCTGSRGTTIYVRSAHLTAGQSVLAGAQCRNRNSLELISTQPRSSIAWRLSLAAAKCLAAAASSEALGSRESATV